MECLLKVPGIHLTTKDGRDKGLVDVARETGNAELVDSLRKAVRTRGGEVAFFSENIFLASGEYSTKVVCVDIMVVLNRTKRL